MNQIEARILIAESGSGFGGSAKYLTSLLSLLDTSRFQVEVVTYGSGPFIQQLIQEKREVHYFPNWRFPWKIVEANSHGSRLKLFLYVFLGMFQLIALVPVIAFWLYKKKVDLIHLNNEILSHLPLLFAGRLMGKQVICHFHGWRNLTSTEKFASHYVDKFIAVTQSGADFYSWQLNGRGVEGIPNGLVIQENNDTSAQSHVRSETRNKLGLKEDDFLAILIGRLIPLKGHSVFFQALAKAKEKNPKIRGLIVGNDPSDNGQYLKKLKLEIETLGMQDNFIFLPWQDHMGPIYQASDVVVQPSIEPESFGYVALEGMAAGKPVIASRLGGLRDVVCDGDTGFLVEAGNSEKLSEAINRIASNASLASDFGIRGKERAKTVFTMTHNAQRITQVYDQLLNPDRILIAESGSGYGGTAKYLTNLLSSIDRNVFAMEVVAYGDGPFVKEIERQWPLMRQGLWRYPWGEKEEVWGKVKTGSFLEQFFNYIFSTVFSLLQIFIMVPRISIWLMRKKISIVHLNNGIRSHIPLLMAAKLAGCSIICHFHGWRSFTHSEQWLTPWVDQFIAISESGATFLRTQISSNNIIAIPNGLPILRQLDVSKDQLQSERSMLQISKDSKVISIIGRLVEWKGQEVYLNALAKVIKHNPDVIGVILGHDPTPNQQYLTKLRAMTVKLGISSHVRFLPWQEDVQTIYHISDIVVHASIDPEPFGLVILEAMFARKAVIATKGGGVSDLINDQESGLLIEPNNSDQLASSMERLISDPTFASQLAKAGEQRAKIFFSIERNASMVQEVYQNLLKEQKSNLIFSRQLKWRPRLKQIMFETGALTLVRESLGFKVPILMYHKISREPDPFFPSISERTFKEQMVYIKRYYQIISLDDLVMCLRSGEKLPRRSIVVTFDDGNAQTLKLVSPILEGLKVPVTVFLSANLAEENNFIWTDLLRLQFKLTKLNQYAIQLNGNRREWHLTNVRERLQAAEEISRKLKKMVNHERKNLMDQLDHDLKVKPSELPNDWLLTGKQIQHLVKTNIKFGAHTLTHPILSRMPLNEARYEIFESKRWLENILNEKVKHFAYPNGEVGDFTEEHQNFVAQAGFDSASSTIIGLNDFSTNPYVLRRIYAAEESLANFASRLVGIGS